MPDVKRIPAVLKLGSFYLVKWSWSWSKQPRIYKFIQPTEKGFNFLDLETSKCLLKYHLYQSKKYTNEYREQKGVYTFFVNEMLSISPITDERILLELTEKFNKE